MRARGVPRPRRSDGGRARRAWAPARPGEPARRGYGYVRNGVADVFMCFAPLLCERRARVTLTRTRAGLAETLGWVSDDLFPEAERIVLVCDNPDTHPVGVALRGVPAGGGRAAGLPPRGPSHA